MPAPPDILTLKLDLIQTLAVAALVYYGGILLKRIIPALDRLNIPSAVVGGLVFAGLTLAARDRFLNVQFDTTAQPLFNVAFFTTIGMGASLSLLKKGGIQVAIFLLMSTFFCFVQNFLGMGIASLFGIHKLVGVVAGSVTLVGGPATGLAFAPLFEQAGVRGADVLAITAATFGIVCGGMTGGPASTWIIKRHRLRGSRDAAEASREMETKAEFLKVELDREDTPFIRNLIVLAVAMGFGSIVSYYFQSQSWTLPAYIGAMIVAAVLRNIDDRTGWLGIELRAMEFTGSVSLNIFLVVALMNLKLWDLFALAIPLFTILLAQVIVVLLFSVTVSYWIMGKDYESAVMAGGFIGFVLGTTANAVANMKTLVGKYGPAPRAFLVVPIVGAFFIDFMNALIINAFLNWFD